LGKQGKTDVNERRAVLPETRNRLCFIGESGAPGETWTPDPLVRSPKAEADVVPGAKGESSRAEMLAFMGGHGFELTAVETQNEGRQENP